MTQRLYVGSSVDCNLVRQTLNYAMDFPKPGTVNGVPIVDEETRQQMVQQWWAMTDQARAAIIANPIAPWIGWTFQFSDLQVEASPGTRNACWVPADMDAVIAASSAAGRTLDIIQITALNAAKLAGIVSHPANWIFPEP